MVDQARPQRDPLRHEYRRARHSREECRDPFRVAIEAVAVSPDGSPTLLSPFRLRDVEFRNRVVVSPMCQYSAEEGIATDWHLVHLGRFALGGAGLVIVEQTAVEPRGRITYGDLGIWSDDHIAPLARIAAFIQHQGAVAGLQLGHAGRKGGRSRPWFGYRPLDASSQETPWILLGPTEEPCGPGWTAPEAMDEAAIVRVLNAYRAAARRADQAGFNVLEVHAAHGYLIHSFLSPISNTRTDQYGGDLSRRMRLAVSIASAIREFWPSHKPLSFRLSVVDGLPGGWELADTYALAKELANVGVDAIDCSSGGVSVAADTTLRPPSHGSQTDLSRIVRRETGMPTIAVGLIRSPEAADALIREGAADLVALAREMLVNPNWTLQAAHHLGADPHYKLWPKQVGLWLEGRDRQIARMEKQDVRA